MEMRTHHLKTGNQYVTMLFFGIIVTSPARVEVILVAPQVSRAVHDNRGSLVGTPSGPPISEQVVLLTLGANPYFKRIKFRFGACANADAYLVSVTRNGGHAINAEIESWGIIP